MKTPLCVLSAFLLAVQAAGGEAAPPGAAPGEVTEIKAACRNGQTFVTWKDVAEGEAGAKYRYVAGLPLYRAPGGVDCQLDRQEV